MQHGPGGNVSGMTAAFSLPPDEDERLNALRRLEILDTQAKPAFDTVVNLARDIFSIPIALVSLLDRDRQ